MTNFARALSIGLRRRGMIVALLVTTLAGLVGYSSPAIAQGLQGDVFANPIEEICIYNYSLDPAHNYVNYWKAIGAPEHTDNIDSGTQPCAVFTGSFDGSNQVQQFVSESTWASIQFVVFDGPQGAYLQGGGLAPPVYPGGQFIAKFNPSTGEQTWLTSTQNANDPLQWIAFGSMGIHKNGYLYATAGPNIYKIDRATGSIVGSAQMKVLGMPATDANFDGFKLAPDDNGTILMKTQTRPIGCPLQGNGAMANCPPPQPNTTVVAVDPDTLQTLDAILLDQEVTARPVVTQHNGSIYVYMAGMATLVRVIWDPTTQTLTQDSSWAPSYLLPGQKVGTAPDVLGDWVVSNTNASPGSVPISVVAVNQDDPSKLVRINPWGTTLPPGIPASETPGSFGVDPENNMIFAQDWFVGGVFGIQLDQATGNMTVVWSRPDWVTSDYFSAIGPKDQRVLISQYLNPSVTFNQKAQCLAQNLCDYTEGVLWTNAATGETVAESSLSNPSTALGSLVNIGYGGLTYTMGNGGSLYIYKVEPQQGRGLLPGYLTRQ